jgi:hypothetical protein
MFAQSVLEYGLAASIATSVQRAWFAARDFVTGLDYNNFVWIGVAAAILWASVRLLSRR